MNEKEYTNKERAAHAMKFVAGLQIEPPAKERLNCTITSKISDETRKEIENLVSSGECASLGEATRWLLELGIAKAHEIFTKEWEDEKKVKGEPKEDDDM